MIDRRFWPVLMGILAAMAIACMPQFANAQSGLLIEADQVSFRSAQLQEVKRERSLGDNRVSEAMLQMIDNTANYERQLGQKSEQVDDLAFQLATSREVVDTLKASKAELARANEQLVSRLNEAERAVAQLSARLVQTSRELEIIRVEYQAAVNRAYALAIAQQYLLDATRLMIPNYVPADSVASVDRAEAIRLFNNGRRDAGEAKFKQVRIAQVEAFQAVNADLTRGNAPTRLNYEYLLSDFRQEARYVSLRIQRGERTTDDLLAIWNAAGDVMPANFEVKLKRADALKTLGRWPEAEALYRFIFENAPPGTKEATNYEFLNAFITLAGEYDKIGVWEDGCRPKMVELLRDYYRRLQHVPEGEPDTCLKRKKKIGIDGYLEAQEREGNWISQATKATEEGKRDVAASSYTMAAFERDGMLNYLSGKKDVKTVYPSLILAEKLFRKGRRTNPAFETELHVALAHVSVYVNYATLKNKGIDWAKRYARFARLSLLADRSNFGKFEEVGTAAYYRVLIENTGVVNKKALFEVSIDTTKIYSEVLFRAPYKDGPLWNERVGIESFFTHIATAPDSVEVNAMRDGMLLTLRDLWHQTRRFRSVNNALEILKAQFRVSNATYRHSRRTNPRLASQTLLSNASIVVGNHNKLVNEARKSNIPTRLKDQLYAEQLAMRGILQIVAGQEEIGLSALLQAIDLSVPLLNGEQSFGYEHLSIPLNLSNIVDYWSLIAETTGQVDHYNAYISWLDGCVAANYCSLPSSSNIEAINFIATARTAIANAGSSNPR